MTAHPLEKRRGSWQQKLPRPELLPKLHTLSVPAGIQEGAWLPRSFQALAPRHPSAPRVIVNHLWAVKGLQKENPTAQNWAWLAHPDRLLAGS